MLRDDDDANSPALAAAAAAAPFSASPQERQVVWKQRPCQAPPSQALPLSGAHLDPMSTAQSGKSFLGRIRVVVRCRPFHRETEGDHTESLVHTHGDEVVVCERNDPSAGRSYRFDRVLSPEADQVTTFAEVAPLVDHVLDGFHATVFAYGQTGSGKTFTMDGLRYVASSSGRSRGNTTVMVPDTGGTPVEQHGIIPRIIQLLFDRARARQRASGEEAEDALADAEAGADRSADDGVEYSFRCSYYQIYNEMITDLLRTTGSSPNLNGNDGSADESGSRNGGARGKRRFDYGGLRVRWQKGDVFKVENLFVCSCASPEEMREVLFTGIQQKVVSSNMMNYQSSRSHCVFTIYVECRARRNGELRSHAELSLVDLAGSEKIGLLSNNPSAKLVKESIDINTSLLALGKVIMALSSNSGGAGTKPKRKAGGAASFAASRSRGRGYATTGTGAVHVPYRDSKLTMLLKHALGGNSLTTMIACISPSDRYVEETTSTLLYAGRAKNIRNAPHVNEDATTTLIRQLREEIAQLKAELGYYRQLAAESLGQPQAAQAHLCSRCGGDLATADSPPSNKVSREMVVATREANQLADSLIAACDMLKNMMHVNAELRDAYDAVRDAQDDAERREADLNAENLALRERLAVLESIVLQDNDEEDDNGDDAMMEEEDGGGALNDSSTGPTTREGLAAARRAAKAAASLRANGGGRGSSPGEKSSTAPPSSSPTAPPAPSLSLSTSSPTSHSPAKRAAALGSPPRPSVKTVKLRPVGSSTSKEVLPHVVLDGDTTRTPAFGPVTPVSPTGEARRPTRAASSTHAGKHDVNQERPIGHRPRRKSLKKKKHRVLAQRLKEYEQHYRTVQKTATYEDYYLQPRRTGGATERAVPGVLPIRASGPEVVKAAATLEDMKATVAKLPKNVVPEYVPSSLLHPGLFGSLAFGGQQEEKTEFEQHRNDRAMRLRALQQRQQALYQQVHQAVRDVHSGNESQREEVPSLLPPSQMPERCSGSACVDRRGSTDERGSRRSSSEQVALPNSATARAPTAVYNTANGGKRSGGGGSRTSTDNMTKLMVYLHKEEL
ncbi:putative Kinesin [Leptomonas pyrrhocoris]|uniref:Putative Kinesin n=1 Tax=Leptomonas pyrrhocoris TaxID=157538 RepID=A0A0M9G4G2_LEPPY|nr:putative Kinesin [Leptomonas pyrrhocoris]KPA82230.1 putative Kinesin [Leptomonas pyrrhocoris]|eukprot:XP_015660669.1 putative Kinesin [Leptomonas pyrrhocoris]